MTSTTQLKTLDKPSNPTMPNTNINPKKMTSSERLVKKSTRMGYNQLYLNYMQNPKVVRDLYPTTSAESVAKSIDSHSYDREALSELLLKQNRIYKAKPKALENIQRLAEPDSLVVFAGQQAGLFGGPLLGFYKAIWAVKRAAELSEKLNRPVIPMFWIAADDHDFEEINHTYTFDVLGEPVQRSYYRVENEGQPAYELKFTDEQLFEELKTSLVDSLGQTDFTEDLLSRLFDAYHTGTDFVTAFGKFFTDAMPDIGLVIFSPGDTDFKRLGGTFFQQTLDKHAELKTALKNANSDILEAGYHLQVQKEESACHLFLLDPDRKAIHTDGEAYRIGEKTYTREQLQTLTQNESARFSPDVLTRPVLAASMFPVVEQGGGPSEVAYFAQLWRLFEIYETPVPLFSGRVSVTLVEKRFEKLMRKHDLNFIDFCGDIEQVINIALGKSFPDNLEERFAKLKDSVKSDFNELSEQVIAFDKTLAANSGQILGKIEHAISVFEKKTFASHKRKMADERAALYRAGNSLFPRHGLQERTLSVVYYLSRYGYAIMDYIDKSVELDTANHQLLFLSEIDN